MGRDIYTMISSQTIFGVSFVGAGFLAAMKFVGGIVDPGAGITVHSLTFVDAPIPAMVQHRTVFAEKALFAGWETVVIEDGRQKCGGAGSWAYASGEASPVIPFDAWVGDTGCWERLTAGATLQACAEYNWGDGENTKACSLGFRKR